MLFCYFPSLTMTRFVYSHEKIMVKKKNPSSSKASNFRTIKEKKIKPGAPRKPGLLCARTGEPWPAACTRCKASASQTSNFTRPVLQFLACFLSCNPVCYLINVPETTFLSRSPHEGSRLEARTSTNHPKRMTQTFLGEPDVFSAFLAR